MAVAFSAVVDRARVPLNDAAKGRYTDDELMSYLADGMMQLVILRPDLFTIIGDIGCVAGIEQTLPAGGIVLADIFQVKNGRGVTRCEIDTLRTFRPTWRTDAAGPTQNWFLIPESPQMQKGPIFGVYPQATAGQILTGQYVMTPTTYQTYAAAGTNVLPVSDDYSVPLEFYVTGRAEMKDDEHVNSQRAQTFMAAFETLVKEANASEQVTS